MSSVQIIKYVAGVYQTNVYLVYDEVSNEAFIIDPGYEFAKIYQDINMLDLTPKYIILTHGHGDHTGGIDRLKNTFPEIKLIANKKEEKLLYNRDMSMGKGGIQADIWVKDGDTLDIGSMHLDFIASPGHTPGGMCIKLQNTLFSGDTLFRMSVGRTDFPGGNYDLLIESVNKLLLLPDDTRVLPGHSEETTIGIERRYNPFV